MTLQTATRTLGDVIVVDCHGQIVRRLAEETAALRHLVTHLMSESPRIVLNLTNVHHIDSTGIGMLVGLHIAAGKVGAAVKLAGLVGHVKSVMETTELITIFDVYPTVEAALASFAPAIPAAKAG